MFCDHNPGLINQQIIQIDDKKLNYHMHLHMFKFKSHYDCPIDTLGPVYPGQILQVDVFASCKYSLQNCSPN